MTLKYLLRFASSELRQRVEDHARRHSRSVNSTINVLVAAALDAERSQVQDGQLR
jgi:hypothetical protein